MLFFFYFFVQDYFSSRAWRTPSSHVCIYALMYYLLIWIWILIYYLLIWIWISIWYKETFKERDDREWVVELFLRQTRYFDQLWVKLVSCKNKINLTELNWTTLKCSKEGKRWIGLSWFSFKNMRISMKALGMRYFSLLFHVHRYIHQILIANTKWKFV